MKVRVYQIVDDKNKYIEDYTIGKGEDFESLDELKAAFDELQGAAFDRYEIEYISNDR